MILKDFVFLHKQDFLKSAKDILDNNPEFVKRCIEEYQCPNVFEELSTGMNLRQTKFFIWWNNRNKNVKKSDIKDNNIEVKKTTQEVVKKKIIKEKKTESKDCIIIQQKPINQTLKITRVYHKLNFETPLAKKTISEVNKELNMLISLRKETVKLNKTISKEVETIISNTIERYKKEEKDSSFCYQKEIEQLKQEIESFIATGTLLNKTSNEYKRYEELKETYDSKVRNFYNNSAKRDESILNRIKTSYDIREKQGNEYSKIIEGLVKIQMAIKGTIENEKQIKENGFYEKTNKELLNKKSEDEIIEEAYREIDEELNIKNVN